MKWNAISVSATCIIIGLGCFLLGKLNGEKTELSEYDRLLESSDRLINQGSTTGSLDSRTRENSNRPNRPIQQQVDSTFNQKLVNMVEIVRGENSLDRGRAMLKWIDSLDGEEFEAAVDHFRKLGLTSNRMGEYSMLLTAWAEIDPVSALAYTMENTRGETMRGGTMRRMATTTVLSAWASRDPDAAIAWAQSNHEGDNANPYMVGIIQGLVESDHVRATALFKEIPFSAERIQALDIMVPHLLKMDSESTTKWIAELSDASSRAVAVARFAAAMAKQDPAGTASWLMENPTDSAIKCIDGVFQEWARTDSEAAIANFESMPGGEARSRALRGIVMVDALDNPQVAADMMNRFSADLTDTTVQQFISSALAKAPDIAADQISLIQDERNRNQMYISTLNFWLNRDKAAAQNWINSTNLPPSVTKFLNNR